MMDADIKAKWVEALRSGKYRQTQGALKRDKPVPGCEAGYCCLGVLADVKGFKFKKYEYGNYDLLDGGGSYQPFVSIIGSRGHLETLWHMNDGVASQGRQYTFSDIADYIEANL